MTRSYPSPPAQAVLGLACALAGFAGFAGASATQAAEPAVGSAIEPAVEGRDADARAGKLVGELNDDQFAVRRQAREELQRLLADSGQAPPVARRLERALLGGGLSTEAAMELESLLKGLPERPPLPPGADPSDDQIVQLIGQLDDDAYAARLAAGNSLRRYGHEPRLACRLLAPLKAALADPARNRETREALLAIHEEARGVWLVDDREDARLPAIADGAIDAWIATLAEPPRLAPPPGVHADDFRRAADAGAVVLLDQFPAPVAREDVRADAAERELLDALCRADCVGRVTEKLAAVIATKSDEDAWRLRQLHAWTHPAMVAEGWRNHHHGLVQHLLVGVPQIHEAVGPDTSVTLFDRIDDQKAHCVRGVTLTEGDYPVGVAIAHPRGDSRTFTLVNLPTPRRRMAYEVTVLRPEAERLRELSERTLGAILAAKRHLDELDILMLEQLDPRVVSKFAGSYFTTVADQPLLTQSLDRKSLSEHEALCEALFRLGLAEAQPALERLAAERGEATGAKPAYARLASLAIAARDPWPKVDPWLVSLIRDPAPFNRRDGQTFDLGAAAAAILLMRHHQPCEEFHLEPLSQPFLQRPAPFGMQEEDPFADSAPVLLRGYRFAQPGDREKALRWWDEVGSRASGGTAG